MLMRNSNTGAFEVYDISHNAITSAASMGQVGLEWTVAGFGDFSGNANETDMLMRNSNTGAFEVYDISHNAITSAASMGQVGFEWQTTGIASQPPIGARRGGATCSGDGLLCARGCSAGGDRRDRADDTSVHSAEPIGRPSTARGVASSLQSPRRSTSASLHGATNREEDHVGTFDAGACSGVGSRRRIGSAGPAAKARLWFLQKPG